NSLMNPAIQNCSALPFIFARVEHGFYHMGSNQLKTARPFKEYMWRFHYDYLNYYPEAWRFLIDEVGSDPILIARDLFAAKDIEYPNSFVEQLKLPPADLDRILRGNANRFAPSLNRLSLQKWRSSRAPYIDRYQCWAIGEFSVTLETNLPPFLAAV